MLYRVKQFFWAIKSLSEDIDKDYVNKFLNKKEKRKRGDSHGLSDGN